MCWLCKFQIAPSKHGRNGNAVDKEEFDKAWEYCKTNSKSVEILYENEDNQKILAKVHFRFYPEVRNHIAIFGYPVICSLF